MATIIELENRISELKNGRTLSQLKTESKKTYYKVQSLSSELSYLKAKTKGNFITKEDLTEYKTLIIFMMNKGNFNGYMNLKEAMTTLLTYIQNNKIVYKTKAGIKGLIADLAVNLAIENSYINLIKSNSIDLTRQNTLNTRILSDFVQFKLQILA